MGLGPHYYCPPNAGSSSRNRYCNVKPTIGTRYYDEFRENPAPRTLNPKLLNPKSEPYSYMDPLGWCSRFRVYCRA